MKNKVHPLSQRNKIMKNNNRDMTFLILLYHIFLNMQNFY